MEAGRRWNAGRAEKNVKKAGGRIEVAKFGWWAKEGAGKVRKWEDGRENDGRGRRDEKRLRRGCMDN